MNYRHHFHAGNFADVFKHALLLDLLSRLQKKDRGILYVDTHAGRGFYNLMVAATGDRLVRRPEHPEGWGRVAAAPQRHPILQRYAELVNATTNRDEGLYPGSPALVAANLRAQDRMHLCELHPEDLSALKARFTGRIRASVHGEDGYNAVRAALPPPEKRALVLIDPPFESETEFDRVLQALGVGLQRLPAATFVVWHPLTARSDHARFYEALGKDIQTPVVTALLEIAGPDSGIRMRGCGLVVVNPPWGFEAEWKTFVAEAARLLSQGPGSRGSLSWLVAEN
ncbi:MAG: 23S rRNA (adenine(2030)-N(6))-methyltransferase RlmJ [Opitutaceae bacterium]|nr:23S rRNA (adenine(2030)-N(6))-methyltransferase RlmJ [Opitutaceae bacterium]